MHELKVEASWRVELPELSAVALRFPEEAPPELLGVGDSRFSIFTGETHPPGASTVSADLQPGSASQWEGIAVDGAGRAFVLQEHPGHKHEPSHVFVFDPDLGGPVHGIDLVVEGDGADWEKGWSDDENARGEGLLLLGDGHLLVVKQEKPIRFIEFGPRGSEPAGLAPSAFLDSGEPFGLPPDSTAEYVPLDSWGLADDEDELETVNDLAVFEDTLYAISRSSERIVRLESSVSPSEESIRIEDGWRVPEDVRHPEGLAILDGLVPIVCDDLSAKEDHGGPNIFVLSRLVGG